eukprot:TRINITY_DN66478_c8_g1_i3.p1 TRINITY_DN66478_c8_g1~~TRINITY_DN66478_c8_g1_i3.p1  ORF type:complete len:210 (-),score=35.36 TRINITY_DN66478_c8_g1_i3:103-732(-)
MLRLAVFLVLCACVGAQTQAPCCAKTTTNLVMQQIAALGKALMTQNKMLTMMQQNLFDIIPHQYWVTRSCGKGGTNTIRVTPCFKNPNGWQTMSLYMTRPGLSVGKQGWLSADKKEIHFTLGSGYRSCMLFSAEDDYVYGKGKLYDHHIASDAWNNCVKFPNYKKNKKNCAKIRNLGTVAALVAPCEAMILRCYRVPSTSPWRKMGKPG